MSVEFIGFMAGIGFAVAAGLYFLSIERWRAVAQVYGRRRPGARGGNALIWPSH